MNTNKTARTQNYKMTNAMNLEKLQAIIGRKQAAFELGITPSSLGGMLSANRIRVTTDNLCKLLIEKLAQNLVVGAPESPVRSWGNTALPNGTHKLRDLQEAYNRGDLKSEEYASNNYDFVGDGGHLLHCNIGEYVGSCKYGQSDTCPAMKQESQEPCVLETMQAEHIAERDALVAELSSAKAEAKDLYTLYHRTCAERDELRAAPAMVMHNPLSDQVLYAVRMQQAAETLAGLSRQMSNDAARFFASVHDVK